MGRIEKAFKLKDEIQEIIQIPVSTTDTFSSGTFWFSFGNSSIRIARNILDNCQFSVISVGKTKESFLICKINPPRNKHLDILIPPEDEFFCLSLVRNMVFTHKQYSDLIELFYSYNGEIDMTFYLREIGCND